jgi:peptide/nickel transport system permease protein
MVGLDRVLPGLMFLQAIPHFFFALILLELFAVKLHVFPIGQGYGQGLVPGWHWDFISSAIYHSLLPALTIVLTSIAGWMLQMRNVMITTIGEDYVVAAQAKGLPRSRWPGRSPAAAAGSRCSWTSWGTSVNRAH